MVQSLRAWAGSAASLTTMFAACTPAGVGSGSVTGTVEGMPFESIGSAWLAGMPDDPSTTVIFVFDDTVSCDALAEPGWDTRIPDGTQALEIKLIGQEPGNYPVPADGRPSSGESDDNYTLTSTTSTPSEISAVSGSVTLDAIAAQDSASGVFDLVFPSGSITGAFASGWCATAHEP